MNNSSTIYSVLYFVVCIVLCCYILFMIYFKLKHRFWASQPVFHFHNIKYWLVPCGIITHEQFPITKYYDPFTIDVLKYDELSNEQLFNMYKLIRGHYLQERDVQYCPDENNIANHFKHHNHACYVAMYNTYKQLFDSSTKRILYKKIPICVLTSRPLYISLYSNKFICNYVDYLCVNKGERKKNIAPKTIYTYAVESRKQSQDIVTYLFKREGELTSIVPLVAYHTNVYDTTYWRSNVAFPLPYKLTRINKENSELLIRDFDTYTNQFDCVIYPNIGNILFLIEQNILIPFIIHNETNIVCIYFFKKTCVTYRDLNMIDLVGSILVDNSFIEFFQLGFQQSFQQLQREDKNIGFINIENLSNNNILITHVNKRFKPLHSIPCSYYFYNFATRPLLYKDVFILN